jgi:uracil-DNA glycosylase family 4
MLDSTFDLDCSRCPRLAEFLEQVRCQYPDYHARPVAPFGDPEGRLLIVGLAPGMHGANATGRHFTGDYAGILLYETLFEWGFSNQPVVHSANDGLILKNCRITNAVKCLPPQNKPIGAEIAECNSYLRAEVKTLPEQAVILALGRIAHQAVLKAYGLKNNAAEFAHNAVYVLPGDQTLVSSYHCSRYNVQTNRLTKAMFNEVFATIKTIL